MMKTAILGALAGLLMLLPAAAMACNHDPEASDLRTEKADAVVLATITDVRPRGTEHRSWTATASVREVLSGKLGERDIEFAEVPDWCDPSWRPKRGRYWVLYVQQQDDGYRVRSWPVGWALRSGDARTAKLKKLFPNGDPGLAGAPLGEARTPTAEETRLIDFADQRLELPGGKAGLRRYTRIYQRASAGIVVIKYFRSRTPRRLMLAPSGEGPTEASCRCRLHETFANLQDLHIAGKLPPLTP